MPPFTGLAEKVIVVPGHTELEGLAVMFTLAGAPLPDTVTFTVLLRTQDPFTD